MNFINKISNLEYSDIKVKDKNLKLQIRKTGSVFSNKFYLISSDYIQPKKEFNKGITRKFIIDLMYKVDLRRKWDDTYKSLEKLEGNDEVYVIKSVLKSPIFIISERDVIDKRIEFVNEDIYYNFSSSVDSDVSFILIFFSFILFSNLVHSRGKRDSKMH